MGKYGRAGRTHRDFVRDLAEIKPTLKVLTKYVGFKQHLRVKCLIDGTLWETTPRLLLYKTKGTCPTCQRLKMANTLLKEGCERIDAKIAKKFGGRIKRVGPYISATTPTRFVCDAGHDILRGPKFVLGTASGCELCGKQEGGLKNRMPLDDLLQHLSKRSITYVSGYSMKTRKCLFRCDKCTNTWETYPYSIMKGWGCPHCAAAAPKNRKTTRIVRLGKRRVQVMGWEDYALKWLRERIDPRLISVACEKKVPVILYKGLDGKAHRHYPDMYIKRRNIIIEVKSVWTIGLASQDARAFKTLQLKAKAARHAGYRYVVLLMMPVRRAKLPRDWESLSFREFRAWAVGKKLLSRRHLTRDDVPIAGNRP